MVKSGKRVVIAAHGNSLRALGKHLEHSTHQPHDLCVPTENAAAALYSAEERLTVIISTGRNIVRFLSHSYQNKSIIMSVLTCTPPYLIVHSEVFR